MCLYFPRSVHYHWICSDKSLTYLSKVKVHCIRHDLADDHILRQLYCIDNMDKDKKHQSLPSSLKQAREDVVWRKTFGSVHLVFRHCTYPSLPLHSSTVVQVFEKTLSWALLRFSRQALLACQWSPFWHTNTHLAAYCPLKALTCVTEM